MSKGRRLDKHGSIALAVLGDQKARGSTWTPQARSSRPGLSPGTSSREA
jgi:hypothetical protein